MNVFPSSLSWKLKNVTEKKLRIVEKLFLEFDLEKRKRNYCEIKFAKTARLHLHHLVLFSDADPECEKRMEQFSFFFFPIATCKFLSFFLSFFLSSFLHDRSSRGRDFLWTVKLCWWRKEWVCCNVAMPAAVLLNTEFFVEWWKWCKK